TAAGHRAIDGGELLDYFGILTGDDLGDPVDTVLAIAGIDPLGAVSKPEVAAALQPRRPLDLRTAQILGDARIDGAFISDRRTPLRVDQPGEHPRRGYHRAKVGALGLVHRRRHGDDVDVSAGALRGVRGQL